MTGNGSLSSSATGRINERRRRGGSLPHGGMPVSRASRAASEDRKGLLSARAALDRARLTLAVHEIRGIVAPPAGAAHIARLRPTAAMVIAVAGPLLGFRRLGRFLRLASIGLFALRVVRSWRG